MDLHLIERARRPGDPLFFYCSKQTTDPDVRARSSESFGLDST